MQRLWFYTQQHRGRLLWGSLMLIFTTATSMAMPQIFRVLIDAIEYGKRHELVEMAMLMVVLAVAGAAFRILSRIHIFYSARNIECELRTDLYRHLLHLPPAYFQKNSVGDLMSRATGDLTQIRMLLGPGLLNVVNTALIYATAIPLLWLISPKLTIISTSILLPSLFLVARLAKVLFLHNRAQRERMGDMSRYIQENLSGTHVIRAFGMSGAQNRGFEEFNRSYYDSSIELVKVRAFLWRLITLFAGGGTLAVFVVGAYDVMAARLTLGELVAVVEYLALLAWPNFALGWVITLWQRGRAGMERINQVMDVELPEAIDMNAAASKAPSLEPTLELKNLSISLDGRKVLDGINLSVGSGETLGVIGSIGSGKSTLLKALVREVEVEPGQVFVGAHDSREIPLARLRQTFGIVHQTPILFSKSVAENVAFAAPELLPVSTAKGESPDYRGPIEDALENACFMRDLDLLPAGLNTPVGEKGVTLSGGQKQRLAIARALLIDPPILVLDDALSAVDGETESQILHSLQNIREGKTTLIVAHRISSVKNADQIIVLDHGKIVQQGKHEQLINETGLYARLARRQEQEKSLESFTDKLEEKLSTGVKP